MHEIIAYVLYDQWYIEGTNASHLAGCVHVDGHPSSLCWQVHLKLHPPVQLWVVAAPTQGRLTRTRKTQGANIEYTCTGVSYHTIYHTVS